MPILCKIHRGDFIESIHVAYAVVVDKKGDTMGYITEKELAISLSKTSHNESAKTF